MFSWLKNKASKVDRGESPAEIYNKISQPVIEMVRRIKAGECEVHILYGVEQARRIDFTTGDIVSSITVGWCNDNKECDFVLGEHWITKPEASALVAAVKYYVVIQEACSYMSERDKWCKLMGVKEND